MDRGVSPAREGVSGRSASAELGWSRTRVTVVSYLPALVLLGLGLALLGPPTAHGKQDDWTALLLAVAAAGYFSAGWARRRAGDAEATAAARAAADATSASFLIVLVVLTVIAVVPLVVVAFLVLRHGVL